MKTNNEHLTNKHPYTGVIPEYISVSRHGRRKPAICHRRGGRNESTSATSSTPVTLRRLEQIPVGGHPRWIIARGRAVVYRASHGPSSRTRASSVRSIRTTASATEYDARMRVGPLRPEACYIDRHPGEEAAARPAGGEAAWADSASMRSARCASRSRASALPSRTHEVLRQAPARVRKSRAAGFARDLSTNLR
jgi:hypothetical protein